MIIKEFYLLFILMYQQFKIIFPYWLLGVFIGSIVSVYISSKITGVVERLHSGKLLLPGIFAAALLGAASPICMYGTIPLIASLGRRNTPQYLLAAFMVSSILINPNLFIFSFALGTPIALLRLGSSLLAGITAGLLIYLCYRGKNLFQFEGFEGRACSVKQKTVKGLMFDMHRCIVKTAPYLFLGILLTALFDRYVPKELFISLFGKHQELGVILAAAMGVPVYVCGGGTIPLLKTWMDAGMTPGAVITFASSGAATKITNLSAVKIILGIRNFIAYLLFQMCFAILAGWLIDLFYRIK